MKRFNSVSEDLYDVLAWIRWIRTRPSLAALVIESGELLEAFPFLLEDLFRYLYKEEPELFAEHELWEDHRFQRKVLDMLISLGLDDLREETSLKEPRAVERAENIGRRLLNILKGQEPQPGEGEGEQGDEEGEGAGGWEEFFSRLFQQEENIRKLLVQAEQEERPLNSDELGEVMKGLEAGFGREDLFRDMREEFRRALAYTHDLKKFARALGRIAMVLRRRLDKVLSGAEELFDVTQGRDISRVLIPELVRLGHPKLAVLFWQKFLQGTLLNYELRSRLPLGKGSKIFMVDLSASMASNNHFRQALEKLIAAALTLYSRRRANFLVIYFQGLESYESSKPPLIYLPLDNPPTADQWLDLATRWGNGGTNFSVPIREAVRLVEEDPRFKDADLVLLTDGKDHRLDEEFVLRFGKKKQRLRFSLVTFLIDVDLNGKRQDNLVTAEQVARLSTKVAKVSEIFDEELLRELAEFYPTPIKPHHPSSEHPLLPVL